jgi:hypothetical protein
MSPRNCLLHPAVLALLVGFVIAGGQARAQDAGPAELDPIRITAPRMEMRCPWAKL